MRPYGEKPRKGKPHTADDCGICASPRGQTDSARHRQKTSARRAGSTEISEQVDVERSLILCACCTIAHADTLCDLCSRNVCYGCVYPDNDGCRGCE